MSQTESPFPSGQSKPRQKSGLSKSAKKACRPKINLSFDRREVASMIGKIRQEVDAHHAFATEMKAKLEKLAESAFSELIKVKELREAIESLKANGGEKALELPSPAQTENPPSNPSPDHSEDQWKQELDRELEKLLMIKKLLESSLPSTLEKVPASAPSPAMGTKKILVVDDDPTTVKIITHFLKQEHYDVTSSLSGVEGLKKAFKEDPALIILDIMMPDLNGFQFLSLYKNDEEKAHIPVVILSSLAEEADVLKGLEIGATDYLTKPFSPQVLLAKIKKILDSGS